MRRSGVASEELASVFEMVAAGRTEQAVGADLGEAARQDVLQEARDEVLHRKGQASGFVRARVSVTEGDVTVCEALERMVTERDAIDVA